MTVPVFGDVDEIESFALRSLGLDIGSATTHLSIARLVFRRQGARLSTRFDVAERRVDYQSPIVLTPYLAGDVIDVDALDTCVASFLADAGVRRREIDTGLVVITGEALNKRNAAALSRWFAERIGIFTCVSAGARHEAILAAHGSGATRYARQTDSRGLCVDIGGGTTKLALVDRGDVTTTMALRLGGRLLAFERNGTVSRLEPSARPLLAQVGAGAAVGEQLDEAVRAKIAEHMGELLTDVVDGTVTPAVLTELSVTEPTRLPAPAELDWIMFSGGVSEFVYAERAADFDDLGPGFGAAIRAAFDRRGIWDRVRPPTERIRATVVGAGEYTLQASGMTSYVSDPGYLPVFGLQVLRVEDRHDEPGHLADDLWRQLRRYDRADFTSDLAVAVVIEYEPRYPDLYRIAESIVRVAGNTGKAPALHIVIDIDIARSLGAILTEELRWRGSVTVLDGISVGELDYLDIGRPPGPVAPMPVTVKSLMFPIDQEDVTEKESTT